MKKNTSKAPTDIESEELQKLIQRLTEFQAIQKEKQEYDGFLSEARQEVDEFALTGDLRDVEKVSSMLVRQAQASLAERRIANVSEKLASAEQALDDEELAVKNLIVTALHQVRNGVVEKIARSLSEHYEDVQAARRHAFQSKQIKEVEGRIASVNYIANTLGGDSILVAQEYLKIAPPIFAEVEEVKKVLGGSIPSENELRAA